LQHRLRLGLATAQRRRELDQVAPHVVHRTGQGRHLSGAAGRDRSGEVTAAKPPRRVRQRLQRPADPPRQQPRDEQRDGRQHRGGDHEPVHEAIDRIRHPRSPATALDQRNASPVTAETGVLEA